MRQKITVVADALSSNQSKVSVAEDHVKAGESTTVTLIAKDAHGNAISGLSLSASLTGTASEGRPFPVGPKKVTVPMLLR